MRKIALPLPLSPLPHSQEMGLHDSDALILWEKRVGDAAKPGVSQLSFLLWCKLGIPRDVSVMRVRDVTIKRLLMICRSSGDKVNLILPYKLREHYSYLKRAQSP
jgi:hypothetical protein